MNFDTLKKLYYTIGEVAEMFEVNTSLIRFWEKEFKQIKPKKNNKGNRLFTVKDIQTLDKVYQLVKIEGFTLDGAKKMLQSPSPSESQIVVPSITSIEDQDIQSVIRRLEKIKAKLIALNN